MNYTSVIKCEHIFTLFVSPAKQEPSTSVKATRKKKKKNRSVVLLYVHTLCATFPQPKLTFSAATALKKFKNLLSRHLRVGCLQLEAGNVGLLIS